MEKKNRMASSEIGEIVFSVIVGAVLATFLACLISHDILFVILIILSVTPVGACAFLLVANHFYEARDFVKRTSNIRATLIFLALPVIITAVYFVQHNNYMNSIPKNHKVAFEVDCTTKYLDGAGSLGDELTYEHSIGENAFRDGDTIEIDVSHPFSIISTIIEDDGIDDVGITESEHYEYSLEDQINITNVVRVKEKGGRKNQGAYAIFSINYVLTRTVPESFTFWDIYFSSDSLMVNLMLWGLIISEAACLFYIVRIWISEQRN